MDRPRALTPCSTRLTFRSTVKVPEAPIFASAFAGRSKFNVFKTCDPRSKHVEGSCDGSTLPVAKKGASTTPTLEGEAE
eukprot:scaffold97197_cov31-Tisochrysis_lutea.AAC.3